MTLKEYILESLGKTFVKIDESQNPNQIEKWFNIKNVLALSYDLAKDNLQIYVKNGDFWNQLIENQMNDNKLLPFDKIKEFDKQTVNVLDDKDDNTQIEYNESGDYEQLDPKSKDIINKRIFIKYIIDYGNKIYAVMNNNEIISNYAKLNNFDLADNCIFLLKLVFAYASNKLKPEMELANLLKAKSAANQMTDIERLILFVQIYMNLLYTHKFDIKTLSELLDMIGIK